MVVLAPPHLSLGVVVADGPAVRAVPVPARRRRVRASERPAPAAAPGVRPLDDRCSRSPGRSDLLGGQKNPVGQLIGNAILLLVGVRALRRLLPLPRRARAGAASDPEPRRDPGGGCSASPSSWLMQGLSVRRARCSRRAARRDRRGRVRPDARSDAGADDDARRRHRLAGRLRDQDPRALRRRRGRADHPGASVDGVGVGNYCDGDRPTPTSGRSRIPTRCCCSRRPRAATPSRAPLRADDRRSPAFVLFRLRRIALAPAAAAIVVSTAAHGLVDVYWVRGTPVLGWLLVGDGVRARREPRAERSLHERPARPRRGRGATARAEALDACLAALGSAYPVTVVDNSSSPAVLRRGRGGTGAPTSIPGGTSASGAA